MSKYILLVVVFLGVISVKAQSINVQKIFLGPPAAQVDNPFLGVRNGNLAVADLDGDGDQDVIMAGTNNDYVIRTELYLNDGLGGFTKVPNSGFSDLSNCAIAIADVDNDGDQDVVLAGENSTFQKETKLYLNNGSAVFTAVPNAGLIGMNRGALAFADVDGDSDQDLLLSGNTLNTTPDTKLYLNNGAGTFSLSTANTFPIARDGDVEFADVDGDNDMDFVMVGESNLGNNYLTQLYINDGSGTFALSSNTFTAVNDGEIEFLDSDQDGDLDLLVAGRITGNKGSTELYLNNGSGSFASSGIGVFEQFYYPAIASGDLNGDGYPEIFISGDTTGLIIRSQLLINDGSGGYYNDSVADLDKFTKGAAEMMDLDGDTALDLIIGGEKYGNIFEGIIYINDGFGVLYEAGGSYFKGVYAGDLDSADVDGDGDLDVFICGYDKYRRAVSELYINNGSGSFSPQSSSSIIKVTSGSCVFGDLDNDGDFDLAVSGLTDIGTVVIELYLNDGSGNFTPQTNSAGLSATREGCLELADIDGDNDLDVFISGRNNFNQNYSELFLNNGSANFTLKTSGSPFINLWNSAAGFEDVDNDGDQDLVVLGQESTSLYHNNLFLNDGLGNFTNSSSTSLMDLRDGSVDFSDFDNDGDEDILFTGQTRNGLKPRTLIYENDSTGNFILLVGPGLHGVYLGDGRWTDLDGDGDNDFVIVGLDSVQARNAIAYRNDAGVFTQVSSTDLRGQYFARILLADLDKDGSNDMVITGLNNSGQMMSYRYVTGVCQLLNGIDSLIACDSLTWIDGKTYFGSNDTATYVTQTAFGCDSVIRLDLFIPEFDTSVVYTGNNSLRVADTVSNIQWIDCLSGNIVPGAIDNDFSGPAPGSFAAVLEQASCTDTSDCFQLPIAGIEEELMALLPEIYPNPSKGTLHVDLGIHCHDILIELFDYSGSLVYREEYKSGQTFTVNVSSYSGHFLLLVTSADEQFTGVPVSIN